MLYFTFSQIQEQIHLIGQNGVIHLLVWLIVVDIATGMLKSFKTKQTNSTVGLFGIVKHVLVLLLVFIVSFYIPLFGFERYAFFFNIYFIVAYAISIAENWVMLGLPMPKFIIETLSKLKDTMDAGQKPDIKAEVLKVDITEEAKDKEENNELQN